MGPPTDERRYAVMVYAVRGTETWRNLGTVEVVASSSYAARLIAVNRLWRAELHDTGARAVCTVQALGEKEET